METKWRVERGSKTYDHHLFKLKVATMMRNVSWKFREPSVVTHEHTHFYHSINDITMQPNLYSTQTGGHFHEVKFVEKDGQPHLEIGPAMKWTDRKLGGGRTKKVATPVEWETILQDGDQAGKEVMLKDEHTHEYEYVGSEKINQQAKQAMREREHAKVKGMMDGPVSSQFAAVKRMTEGGGAEGDKGRSVLKGE